VPIARFSYLWRHTIEQAAAARAVAGKAAAEKAAQQKVLSYKALVPWLDVPLILHVDDCLVAQQKVLL
jgi:hypothetical protein